MGRPYEAEAAGAALARALASRCSIRARAIGGAASDRLCSLRVCTLLWGTGRMCAELLLRGRLLGIRRSRGRGLLS